MNRPCEKCLKHISGKCSSWKCIPETLEEHDAKIRAEQSGWKELFYEQPAEDGEYLVAWEYVGNVPDSFKNKTFYGIWEWDSEQVENEWCVDLSLYRPDNIVVTHWMELPEVPKGVETKNAKFKKEL